MIYEAKPKRISKKLISILIISILLIVSIGIYFLLPEEEQLEGNTFCELDIKQTQELFNKEYENTYTVSDYLFYGESFNIYKNKYNLKINDPIISKTIILVNICNGEEYPFLLENFNDRQIALNEMPVGLYEVYINDMSDLTRKRVITDKIFNDSISLVNRNNSSNKVTITSDPNILDNGSKLDNNYLYINIEEDNNNDYDIILDPYGSDQDFTYNVNYGYSNNNIIEANETYDFALKLKEELEKHGLKVLISRNNLEEVVNTYGDDSRMDRAYKSNAKYYIQICMGGSSFEELSGLYIEYGNRTSSSLSDRLIMNAKKENIPLYQDGTIQSSTVIGKDNKNIYDANMYLRESGGYATKAAYYSDNSALNTIAKDNKHGLYSISINLAFMSNDDNLNYYINNKNTYVEVLTNTLISNLKVD